MKVIPAIFLFITLLVTPRVFAQQGEIDSLRRFISMYEQSIDTSYIRMLNRIAFNYYSIRPDSSLFFAEKAIALSKKIPFPAGVADGTRIIGIYHIIQGDYEAALEAFRESLEIYEKIKDPIGQARCYNNIGVVFFDKTNYGKALEYFYKSLKLEEEAKNKSGIANTMINIGLINQAMGNNEKALGILAESLEVFESINDEYSIGIVLENFGSILYTQKKYDEALPYLLRALEVEEKIGNTQGVASTLTSLGVLYLELERYDEAYEALSKGLALEESTDNKRGIASSLAGISQLYQKKGESTKAIDFAKRGLKLANETEALSQIKELNHHLYNIYKENGDIAQALSFFEMYKAASDSLLNVEKAKAVANIETSLVLEKKDLLLTQEQNARLAQRRILYLITFALILALLLIAYIVHTRYRLKRAHKLLEKSHQKITSQTEELQKLNATKDRLFAIIGHDMRSPINSLKNMLDLLQSKVITQDDFLSLSKKLKESVDNIYFTLNNMLLWANSQMRGIKARPQFVNLYKISQESMNLFLDLSENKKISVMNKIKEDAVAFADEDQLKVIFRNLLSNAVKFTPIGGSITLNCHQTDNFQEISFADTGAGIDPNILKEIFQTPINKSTVGTNNEKGTGIGLMLCKDFAQSNGGSIRVESEVAKGSTFYLSIPFK